MPRPLPGVASSGPRSLAQALRDIFNCPTQADAESMLARHLKAFREHNEALADWMEENLPEGFTVFAFPRSAVNGGEELKRVAV